MTVVHKQLQLTDSDSINSRETTAELNTHLPPLTVTMDNTKNVPRPELVHKLEGCTDQVNGVVILPGEDGVISISDDRSVRLWLLRDSGQFWPSICHYMSSAASSISYSHHNRRLFIGLETGAVEEFLIARDYNRMETERVYHAHTGRVMDTVFSESKNWLLSCGRDKYFQFHCTNTGKRLGGYMCTAWATVIAYDEEAQYVFIGDYSGAITVCKLEQNGVNFINILKVILSIPPAGALRDCCRVIAVVSVALPGTVPRTGCTPAVTTAPSLSGISGVAGARSTNYTDTGAR